jgi:hypothetical protein
MSFRVDKAFFRPCVVMNPDSRHSDVFLATTNCNSEIFCAEIPFFTPGGNLLRVWRFEGMLRCANRSVARRMALSMLVVFFLGPICCHAQQVRRDDSHASAEDADVVVDEGEGYGGLIVLGITLGILHVLMGPDHLA